MNLLSHSLFFLSFKMKSMDNEQPAFTTSHFFKVLMPGFHQKLNVPPAVSKELEKFTSETAIVESRIGRWKIGMSRNCDNDLICFEQGWPEFVDCHALTIGDFLVFKSTTQHLHFTVCAFDSSACEKEFSTPIPPTDMEEEETPYFLKTMLPGHANKDARVYIPKEFMRSNNLGEQKGAVLRDGRGRSWKVRMTPSGSDRCLQRLSTGWHPFYVSNYLKDGDTCVFKLIPAKLTRTTIFFDVHIRNGSS